LVGRKAKEAVVPEDEVREAFKVPIVFDNIIFNILM
jgi:hypothetical protein